MEFFTLNAFQSLESFARKLPRDNKLRVVLVDTFFSDGDYYYMTKAAVKNGYVVSAERFIPKSDFMETIHRDRMMRIETDDTLKNMVPDEYLSLFDDSFAF